MRAGWNQWLAIGASASALFMSSCGKSGDQEGSGRQAAVAAETTAASRNQPGGESATSGQVLPFKEAVLFEPPEGEKRPPDRTVAGKNVGAMFEAIAGQEGSVGLWDKVALTSADGKKLRYTARLKTDLGVIEIELYAQSAPNHVRNFVALARAGYYDGLPFHRSLNKSVDGEALAYLEGGCPLGTGESGQGSIGYWLRPEISPALTHEEGTIGAVRGESIESAACRFYINLTKAPGMDGAYTIFGKITKGLDIAHTINKRPVIEDEDLSDRPRDPVIIREVTIQVSPENAALVARNP